MEAPGYWDNPEKAQQGMIILKGLKDEVETYEGLTTSYEDIETLLEMGYEEADESLIPEVQAEMDDFGSGYSSLHMLKEVPVDRIKLDLYFLTETGDQKRGSNIIKHMIQMARSLEMDIIAEGVEKTEQAEFLIENGCYEMQGFYFYKPMPVQEFEKLNENYKVKNEMNCT